MDMGIHCIDLLQYISGTRAVNVSAFIQNQTFSYNVEDSAAVLLKMENGATAYIDTNFNIPDTAALCRMEFYGTGGSILAQGTIGQTESGSVFVCTEDGELNYNAKQNRDNGAFYELDVECGDMYEKEITAFSNAIINDIEPLVGASDAIFVQRVIEAAYEASSTGKTTAVH